MGSNGQQMLARSKYFDNAVSVPTSSHHAQALRAFNPQALRAFNRFCSGPISGLSGGLRASRFSLTESRLLWELAQRPGLTAAELARDLSLNAGYLSRLLASLRGQGLVLAQRSLLDGRQWRLSLSAAGRRAFAALDRASQAQALSLLQPLSAPQQQELLYATQRVRQLLSPVDAAPPPPLLRSLQPGELGWVVARHGALYAAECGWNQRFEALVARIAADYVDQLEPRRESAWIADCNSHAVGCIFLVQARHGKTGAPLPGVAQLRMLLVEPTARGQGIGKLLVQACHRWAAQAGYRKIRLWTYSLLLAARGIYRAAGYRLLCSQAHHSFGHDLVGEVWELDLSAAAVQPSKAWA